jgi:hypothetical protein
VVNRLLLAFSLLCVAHISYASNWVQVSDSNGVSYFADASTPKPEKNPTGIMDVSVRADFTTTQTASYAANLSYQSTITAYRIDCANNFISVRGVAYYPDSAARGKALRRYTFSDPKQQDIVPWSTFDDIKKYACKNVAAHIQEPTLEDMKPTIIHDTRKSAFSHGAK